MTHGYDYPIPSMVGAKLIGLTVAGPWMKPYMIEKGINNQQDQNKIAKRLIQDFGSYRETVGDN